jgi:phosphoribosylaminoimidazole carboxylase
VQKDNICHLVIAPAQIDGQLATEAEKLAVNVASLFDGAGIFGVELFLTNEDELLVNEVAPRPHNSGTLDLLKVPYTNSGHYTIEACDTSQYEQHLRCITGLQLGSTKMHVSAAIMFNIIGLGNGDEGMRKTMQPCIDALSIPGASGTFA